MDYSLVKIAVFTPVSHADLIRKTLAEAGAGQIGNYDNCSFSSRGTGRFRPLEGSDPFIGKTGRTEEAEEEKIEVICPADKMAAVLEAVKKAHPYEEPAIDVYPLLNG